jgi:hypothetical protein
MSRNNVPEYNKEVVYEPPYDPQYIPPALEPPAQPSIVPARERLISAMGLRYDPFITSVSESDPAASFGEIYVDRQPSLLDLLQRANSTLIFAKYGMGKTATRRALEYTLRNTDDDHPALCVTYRPQANSGTMSSAEWLPHHLAAIAAEISIDLIIQLIERLDDGIWRFIDGPTSRSFDQISNNHWQFAARHIAALQRQVRALPPNLQTHLRLAAEATTHTDGILWQPFRAAARHVARTPQWRALIGQLAKCADQWKPFPSSWEQTLQDVQTLGFSRIFLLVDAVDEDHIERSTLRAMLEPLLEALDKFQSRDIFLKCFFPASLEELSLERNPSWIRGLTSLPEVVNIVEANQEHLQDIIEARLEAAYQQNGSDDPRASVRTLDWFKGNDIAQGIQEQLARLAQGSPRRMLELASALLDFHSQHGFEENERLWITASEWAEFLTQLKRMLLAPP